MAQTFAPNEKQLLIDAGLPADKIAQLEAEDYGKLVGLRKKDAAWFQAKLGITEGLADGIVGAIDAHFTAPAAAPAPAPVAAPPQGGGGGGGSELAAVMQAFIPVESMELPAVLPLLKAQPSDVRYYQRALSLLSVDGTTTGQQMQVIVVDDGKLDLSGMRLEDTIACANFCRMRTLTAPAGRWPCADGHERKTITLDDAMMLKLVMSCFPTKDVHSPDGRGRTFRPLTDMGGKYMGPGNVDYKALYDTDWAARIRFAYMPEADLLYGSGVDKQLLPEGVSYAQMVKDVKEMIKTGTVADEYKELVDAWERADKAHPALVAQAKAALLGSNEEARRANRERLEAMKTQQTGAGGRPQFPFQPGR